MDLTSRSIWDKKKRTNCYFYFPLLPFFNSLRWEQNTTSAFSKPLIVFLNFYCIQLFLYYFFIIILWYFFSFTSSMEVLLQPFNHSHWFSPAPSLCIVSVLILPFERSDLWKLQYWFALGHHWMGWSIWGVFYMVPKSLHRNKSPWLQVSPMKLIPIKILTLTKDCVIFLL